MDEVRDDETEEHVDRIMSSGRNHEYTHRERVHIPPRIPNAVTNENESHHGSEGRVPGKYFIVNTSLDKFLRRHFCILVSGIWKNGHCHGRKTK